MSKMGFFGAFLACVFLRGPACFAGTAVVIQPVSASGANTIIGSDIYLPAGDQRVRLEIRIAGWGEEHLKTVQVQINSAGFDNGSIPIHHAMVSCPSNNSAGHSFCAQTFETGSGCRVGCEPGSTVNCFCESGFINKVRSDYAATGSNHVAAFDLSSQDYRVGFAIFPGEYVIDPGSSMYLGTMFVDVPAGAQGVYSIGIIAGETFMQNEDAAGQNDIPIDLLTPARIIIGDPLAPGSRYVAYQANVAGQTAVRVMMKSLYHPGPPVVPGEDRDFSALEGFVRWAGPPGTFADNAPGSRILAASLGCTPHFTDWQSLGTVHLYGDAVIPSSVYFVWQVPVSCQADPDNPSCFTPVQTIHTGQWGDATVPFARSDQAAQPDMADIGTIVDGFRGVSGSASKSLTQLRGGTVTPSSAINFIDVQLALDAFQGKPFPYPVPAPCP